MSPSTDSRDSRRAIHKFTVVGASGPATAEFRAANGDRFFAAGNGQATILGDLVSVVETNTITGGTGRFRGVTGHVTVIRLVTRATGASVGALDGQLVK